jgi:hypothetical protein
LLVGLAGVDTAIDEQSMVDALADGLLLFLGDEILSVSSVELAGAGVYRLAVVRARFGTRKVTHLAGADAWLIAREDVVALSHPSFRVGAEISLKVPMAGGGVSGDVSAADAEPYLITGERFISAPLNLRINGQSVNPVHTSGDSLLVDWSLPDGLDVSGEGLFRYRTRVEVFDAGDNLLASLISHTQSLSITPVEMAETAPAMVTVRLEAVSEEHQINSETIQLGVTTS